MSPSDSLFVTYTPYHQLASYAIAANSDARCHLFVQPTADNYERLVELLTSTDVFESHTILEDPYDEDFEHRSNRYRKRVVRSNIRTIRSFLQSTDVDTVYTTLDEREIDQAAMHFATRYGTEATCAHYEDGCFDYNDVRTEWSPYRSDVLNVVTTYLLFGFVWEYPPMVRGTNSMISEVHAASPEHARPELQHYPIHRIPPDGLLALGRSQALRTYFERFDINEKRLGAIDAVVLPPLDSDEEDNDAVEAIFEEAVATIESAGYRVGLKYHPRQNPATPMELASEDSVEIPKGIPLELLYVSEWADIDLVLGRRSTALKSALWLSENISVVSLYPLLTKRELTYDDFDRSSLMDMFDGFGAHLVDDLDDLHAMIPM